MSRNYVMDSWVLNSIQDQSYFMIHKACWVKTALKSVLCVNFLNFILYNFLLRTIQYFFKNLTFYLSLKT